MIAINNEWLKVFPRGTRRISIKSWENLKVSIFIHFNAFFFSFDVPQSRDASSRFQVKGNTDHIPLQVF